MEKRVLINFENQQNKDKKQIVCYEKEIKNNQTKINAFQLSNINSALTAGIGALAMVAGCIMMVNGCNARFSELNPETMSELNAICIGLAIATIGGVVICSEMIKILDNLASMTGLEKEIAIIKSELEKEECTIQAKETSLKTETKKERNETDLFR